MEPAQLPAAFHAAVEVVRSHVDYRDYTALPYKERCSTNAYWRLPTYAAPPTSHRPLIVQEPHEPGVQLMAERIEGSRAVVREFVNLDALNRFTLVFAIMYLKLDRDNRLSANVRQSQGIMEDLLRRLQRP